MLVEEVRALVLEGWGAFVEHRWVPIGCAWIALYFFFTLAPVFVIGPAIAKESLGGSTAWAVILTGEAVGALLDAVLRCQVDGDWERLKVCAEDSCRWAYFDASRNRSGRWCSMSECGNRVKMRRAYATRRRRERAEPAG